MSTLWKVSSPQTFDQIMRDCDRNVIKNLEKEKNSMESSVYKLKVEVHNLKEENTQLKKKIEELLAEQKLYGLLKDEKQESEAISSLKG